MQSNVIKIIIGVSLLIGVGALYLLLSLKTPDKPLAGQVNIYEDNAEIGGDFELIDQNGEIFSSDELKGKLSLIYFGFTSCPDICPTSLNKITKAVEILSENKIDIVPVFITIDPSRDTPAVLKEYLKHFHPKFIGLTGNEKQIREVADKFKVYYAKAASENDNDQDYMLDHSSFTYLMDKNGKYLKHFYLDSAPSEIMEFLKSN
ncbi:photosynthetic protein synthase II [Rickettsia sp. MEAM1 (Bemisia tabaci)]|uniref:SCO family protein n=1 Tax=unclassified Rickettsia TaxID=114295 RepID=UPI0003074B4E|nr:MULTISPECIES: SCO family protein [unclassified Rickettsia]MCC8377897.1 SCO family protein [Rickettsia endosymbiont of Graphium doson]HJD67184.1 SCO family protein [Rickettsia endosymbiont of Bembidion lapponicum]ASX27441.1 photosynthetic protein synthase II [Rickettsia sp. MEAM1 (Bemisia tabaci)]ODA36577.1 photosynthetic protein synthase II [Rickettsia sp. wb]ODA36940.1 photosynthetic protein synthase II [Rickettsia sp. wq]